MKRNTLKLARLAATTLTEDSVTDLHRAIVDAIDEATGTGKLMTEKFSYDITDGIFHYNVPSKVIKRALSECCLDDDIAVVIEESL